MTQSYDTAIENMTADETLITNLANNEHFHRFYLWKTPGITYSHKHTCPDHLKPLDQSPRLTGGGIVYHSPNDVVFSMGAHRHNPHYPQKPSQIIRWVTSLINETLTSLTIPVTMMTESNHVDYTYCHTYPTPFELAVHNQKIVGLTIRQFKDRWLLQGVIHTQPSHPSFLPHYQLEISLNAHDVMNSLITHFKVAAAQINR